MVMKMDFRAWAALCLLGLTAQGFSHGAEAQQQTEPPTARPPPPGWVRSVSSVYDSNADGFQYRPLRFHLDGGGTITQRSAEQDFDNGWNAGLGLTWYPTSLLPLGLRVDGTYQEFNARGLLLGQATATYGTQVDEGTLKMWGGDTDLELDLHLSHFVHTYLLAGGGWYRQQTTFRQYQYASVNFCYYWWGCGPGYLQTTATVARNLSDWHFARNAGFGLEFAMGPRASFFAEARYMRLDPTRAKSDFLPIRAGFRF
jgi:hypothetical protein